MNRFFRFVVLIISICIFVCSLQGICLAKVYIDIDAPGFQQFPVAVCDFQFRPPQPAKSGDIGVALADQIRSSLRLTGIFNTLDKKSFLDGVEPGTETIRFPDWAIIGADFLLRGYITLGSKDIIVESHLYEVAPGPGAFQ